MWALLTSRVRPNTLLLWSLLGFFALLDALLLPHAGMTVDRDAMLYGTIPLGLLLGISAIYTYPRKDARIATMTHVSAAYLCVIATLAILSYIAVSWRMPLVDAAMDAADRAIGLDWRAAHAWTAAHPRLHMTLTIAYASLRVQMIALILILTFTGRLSRAWETFWLFFVSCIGCIVISAPWPAIGAFGYYHVEENRTYVQIFHALYEGTLSVIGKDPIDGVVQFPSLHAALAILFAYAARGIPVFFLVMLVLNVVMFLSTPTIGGHYFVDVLGGVALALMSIFVVRKMEKSGIFPK